MLQGVLRKEYIRDTLFIVSCDGTGIVTEPYRAADDLKLSNRLVSPGNISVHAEFPAITETMTKKNRPKQLGTVF